MEHFKELRSEARPLGVGRRELLSLSTAFGASFIARQGIASGQVPETTPARGRSKAPSSLRMKKAINLWAFPYPDQWTLQHCLELAKEAGFDGVELNFNLTGEFSAESTSREIEAIRKLADDVEIDISGVCSFLFWPYPLTHNDPTRRSQAIELTRKMIEAARLLGTQNLLVVPGAVYAGWVEQFEPVPNDVCERRAKEAIRSILPAAEKSGVFLNIENIFTNGFLMSPQEMMDFVDSFQSEFVRVHFDTGNIMHYQFPEHWVPILGKRIQNIHFKEWDKRTQEFNLHTFRTLLDGTTNWPAVIEELSRIDYQGYLTFEYFHPFSHYPEALIHQTSEALDWMLGRKV